jgi:hypothetical protein
MTPYQAISVRLHEPAAGAGPNIARLARERLQDSSYPDLRTIDCDLVDGVLTLRGRVCSFHMKQVAQVIAARVADVACLNNELVVVDAPRTTTKKLVARNSLRSSAS